MELMDKISTVLRWVVIGTLLSAVVSGMLIFKMSQSKSRNDKDVNLNS